MRAGRQMILEARRKAVLKVRHRDQGSKLGEVPPPRKGRNPSRRESSVPASTSAPGGQGTEGKSVDLKERIKVVCRLASGGMRRCRFFSPSRRLAATGPWHGRAFPSAILNGHALCAMDGEAGVLHWRSRSRSRNRSRRCSLVIGTNGARRSFWFCLFFASRAPLGLLGALASHAPARERASHNELRRRDSPVRAAFRCGGSMMSG